MSVAFSPDGRRLASTGGDPAFLEVLDDPAGTPAAASNCDLIMAAASR